MFVHIALSQTFVLMQTCQSRRYFLGQCVSPYFSFPHRLFSEEEIQEIENTTLADIITQVTYIRKEQLPEDVFVCSTWMTILIPPP